MKVLLRNISELLVTDNQNDKLSGKKMSQLKSTSDAYLIIDGELISDYGSMNNCPPAGFDKEIDLKGKMVLPAWCDSHTHIVFAKTREGEFVDRINGLSYEEIAKRGGGILNSAKKLRDTDESELYDSAMERIAEIRGLGTGAVEIKSGYGLSVASELKMLRVIRKIKENSDLEVRSTFLGAHAYPIEYKDNHQAYLKLLIDDMLPQIADEGLADYIDVFCDRGFFSEAETDQILAAGTKYGLKAKIHANELDFSGGIQVGVKHGALSVDHLECTGDEEIAVLLDSNTMPTLLPSTAFFLGMEYPPARKMIDKGLPIALASDYNPGSSPSGSMSFVLSLACIKMKMLPAEAINAATINGAYAMDLSKSHGSICKGKLANLIVTKPLDNIARIPYSFGSDLIDKVIIKGKI